MNEPVDDLKETIKNLAQINELLIQEKEQLKEQLKFKPWTEAFQAGVNRAEELIRDVAVESVMKCCPKGVKDIRNPDGPPSRCEGCLRLMDMFKIKESELK